MKTAFTLALAVGVASASNLRTVAGGDIKFLRANPGATGMSSGQGDELPPCAQYCQGKPTTCEMAFEFMEPQGCGGSCPQAMKEQLLMEMGCSPDTAATGGGDPANVEGGANNYATGAATDGTMKDCGPYGLKDTFTCGKTCHMLCMDESGGGTMDGMNADSTMTGAATDGTMKDCGPYGPKDTFTCGKTCNMKCMDESGGGTMGGMNADSTMTGAATDGTMNDCGPFGPENTFTCGQTCNMKCIEEVVV